MEKNYQNGRLWALALIGGVHIEHIFIPRQDDLTTHLKRTFLAPWSHWQHRKEMSAYFWVTGGLTEMEVCPKGAGPSWAWQKGLFLFIKQLLEISWQPQLKNTKLPGQSHSSDSMWTPFFHCKSPWSRPIPPQCREREIRAFACTVSETQPGAQYRTLWSG